MCAAGAGRARRQARAPRQRGAVERRRPRGPAHKLRGARVPTRAACKERSASTEPGPARASQRARFRLAAVFAF